jgi:signal recognition particle subunit SRP54
MGEGLDRLEEFRAEGMASRILGFGDVVGLMKDFEEVVDEDKAERDARKMLRGNFTLDDFLEQISMLQQMGPLQDMMEKLPFFADSVPEGFQVNEGELGKIKSIVRSMTKAERKKPELFVKERTRIERVAKGSGHTPKDVADLLQRFSFMQRMMGQIGQQASMLQKLPGMRQLAMANRLKDAVKTGGLDNNMMMANLADHLLEAAVADGPGGPGQSLPPGARARFDANKRKAQRKAQRKARKKARR